MKKFLTIFLLCIIIPTLIIIGGDIEQRIYLSKALPILKTISSLDDKRIKELNALSNSDILGFTSQFSTIKLKDGWVIVLDRLYVADEDPASWQEFFKHRIIIYKDSTGRIYIKATGFPPCDTVNQKGEDCYEPIESISVSDFFNSEKNIVDPGWHFSVQNE
jgi:hypothetical protein